MSNQKGISAHIVTCENGVGLSRDRRLLVDALTAHGHRVEATNTRRRGGVAGVVQRVQRIRHAAHLIDRQRRGLPSPYDVVLMEEHIVPEHLGDGRLRVLLPHPEWCLPRDIELLGRIDLVLAKTRETERIFAARGCRTACIGFTSVDRRDAAVARERTFFHLAGSSRNKNTEPLLALWRAHPEWPRLTVVQHPREAKPGAPAANIVHRVDYLDDAELQRLQNANRFHLCPSETEGFGHYMVEAMSVGAVTITLDAPPMNETITRERGVLVAHGGTGVQNLATTYRFDAAAMTAAIERVLDMDDAHCAQLGNAARAWYESERTAFPLRLDAALRSALADRRSA